MTGKFRFRAFDAAGVLVAGEVEATSQPQGLRAIELRGLVPFEVGDGGTTGGARLRLPSIRSAGRLSLAHRAGLARELATLMQASLPLDQALRVMAQQPRPAVVARFLRSASDAVLGGAALSDAFKGQAGGFPDDEASVIRAGESSASLAQVLDELAGSLETRLELRSCIASALTYPAILLVMAVASVVVVISVLVPNLVPLFDGAGTDMPMVLWMLAAAAEAVERHWPSLAVAGVCSVAVLHLALRHDRVRAAIDRVTWRLPLIGPLAAQLETGRVCRSLSSLLKSGVPLPQALPIAGGICRNRMTRELLGGAADRVMAGSRLSEALADGPVFPPTVRQLIAIGEEANRMDQMLLQLAKANEAAAARQIERLMTLLTPTLTIAIGLGIGGLIMSVMQAILSVNDLVTP